MRKKILTFFALIGLFSCNGKKDPSELIANGNYKFWLVEKNKDARGKSQYFYYFDKEGKWLVFKRGYGDKKFSKLDRGDVYFYETWKLLNDSTVDIGTRPYHIKKLTAEEFIFTDKAGGYKKKLVIAPDSLIPKEYQKMY